jgi:hypothetical protein
MYHIFVPILLYGFGAVLTSCKKSSCRVSLQCELLNVVSICMQRHMTLYTVCSCGASHHCGILNVYARHLTVQMTFHTWSS